jgi:hypothetical protein
MVTEVITYIKQYAMTSSETYYLVNIKIMGNAGIGAAG